MARVRLRTRGHELVVGSLLCSERFFSGFPLSSKINISKFQFDRMQDLPGKHFRVSGASWVNIANYIVIIIIGLEERLPLTLPSIWKGLCHDIWSYFKRLKDVFKSVET